MKSQIFWKAMMAGSIMGWVFIFWGVFFPFEAGSIKILWIIVLLSWAVLHPLELTLSFPVGKEKGLTPEQVFMKTMLFGFTWWLPLKMGVFEE